MPEYNFESGYRTIEKFEDAAREILRLAGVAKINVRTKILKVLSENKGKSARVTVHDPNSIKAYYLFIRGVIGDVERWMVNLGSKENPKQINIDHIYRIEILD